MLLRWQIGRRLAMFMKRVEMVVVMELWRFK